MSERLYLDRNVFFREIDGAYLFLDSAKDKYLTLTGAQAEWFSEMRQSGNASTLSANALKFSDRLAQSGLVRTQSQGGKPIEEIHYQDPEYSVFRRGADVPPSASLKDGPRFFMTYVASCLSHRRNKTDVSRTLQTVRHWKSGLPAARTDLRKRAIDLTERFHGLTPFFYTSHDACFFTSLFLVKYLSRFGLSADWVFAVRLVPFSAHCWVEFDHVVLNEDYDKTLAFKPIMLA